MEEGSEAFVADNGACRIDCAAVVVTRVKVWVLEAALQLQTGLEHLGGHIDDRCGQVTNETAREVGNVRLDTGIDHVPLAELVGAEEDDGAGEGAKEGGQPAAVEAAADAFLAQDGVVGGAEGSVFGRDVGVALLSCLDCVEGVHEHVAKRAADATSEHGLGELAVCHLVKKKVLCTHVDIGRPPLLLVAAACYHLRLSYRVGSGPRATIESVSRPVTGRDPWSSAEEREKV